MESLILAVDQGTTNTKAILVDVRGRVLRERRRSPGISYPRATWVEQEPIDLWNSVRQAVGNACKPPRAERLPPLQ